jgi:hypothetical protein
MIAQDEFELADQRREVPSSGVVAEIRQIYRASKQYGGLLSQSQAARILCVGSANISSLVLRGRLSSVWVAGVRMVSGAEVLALHKERSAEDRALGGRGLKSPSLASMVDAAWQDILQD